MIFKNTKKYEIWNGTASNGKIKAIGTPVVFIIAGRHIARGEFGRVLFLELSGIRHSVIGKDAAISYVKPPKIQPGRPKPFKVNVINHPFINVLLRKRLLTEVHRKG